MTTRKSNPQDTEVNLIANCKTGTEPLSPRALAYAYLLDTFDTRARILANLVSTSPQRNSGGETIEAFIVAARAQISFGAFDE